MPSAVVEMELRRRAGALDVPGGYSRALVLLRWAGRPVGQLELPVTDGQVAAAVIEEALTRHVTWDFWLAWLYDSIGWDEAHGPRGRVALGRPPSPATVVVCTHDRPNELARCLYALMALPDDGQDFLVIDNRPSNHAAARVVTGYPRVRYVRHDEGGLNAARNRGLREARHDIVAFTDDDAFVDPRWLRSLTRNFADPRVQCVTGLTLPAELETEAQECFERYTPFGRGYARRVFTSADRNPMAVGPIGAGANMAVRRTLVESVGEFDEALDGGTPTLSGGDHEMFSRILSAGFHIVYDPAALSWHRHRRSFRELRQTLRGYGTGVYAMWTRALLVGREVSVLKQAVAWLRHGQLPELARSLSPCRRRVPLGLLFAEFRGCLAGPRAYLASRRALERRASGSPSNPEQTGWREARRAPRRT